ncbi:MAG: preprotein translocase subunit SecG [Nitratireductor sp.]
METVLIVIHLMVVFALVVVVLLQRSEGGALGMGGGGGGFMSARGAANALTKTTALLAATFFATSIALGIYANVNESSVDVLDNVQSAPVGDGTSILDQITPENERAQDPENPSVPTGN